MEKQSITRKVQRFALLCSMFIMAFFFAMTNCREAKAGEWDKGKKGSKCALQSVTFEVDGTEYVCDGRLKTIEIDSATNWNEFFKKMVIKDYKVLVNDRCSHEQGHDSLSVYADVQNGYCSSGISLFTYENEKNTYTGAETDFPYAPYVDICFWLDGDENCQVSIRFAKRYNITYETGDGNFVEGMEVPTSYLAGHENFSLPPVEREGYQFTGWTVRGEGEDSQITVSEPQVCVDVLSYWNSGENLVATANWSTEARTSIEGMKVEYWNESLVLEYEEEGVTLSFDISDENENALRENVNYVVLYKNNTQVGQSDAENPPTIIIKGIGKYSGQLEQTFTIEQAQTFVLTPPIAGAIEEGQKLSSSTLSGGEVVNEDGHEIKGSFEWKDGEIMPTIQDSESTKYTVIFKPENTNYEQSEREISLTVNVPAPSPTPTIEPSPTASPTVTAAPSPTASPAATEAPIQTATPIIQPTSTPENKQDVTSLSAGTKIKDKEQKAHYVIREEKEGAVEIQYVAPVKKTAKVTIPKTVTLENGTVAKVTSIAPNAFKNNTTLQQITIADTVTTIGKNAFSGCKKLKKITIGKKVTTIGSNAFKNCKNIKTIVITSKKLKNLSKSAFKGITSKTTIKVPASMYKAYKKLLRKCGLKSSVKIKK
ncbi:MAG: leucine-rich repeat protein [Clostridiales bacterium]|nr:leucine-rich repeat protein [Clostridiales bacterium]